MLAPTQRRAVHTQWAGHKPTHTFIYTYYGSLHPGLYWLHLHEQLLQKKSGEEAEPFIAISVFLPPPVLICPQCHPSQEAGLEMHSALWFREHTFLERFLRGDFTQLPIICWSCLSGGLGYKGTEAIDPIKGIPWEQSKKGSTRQIQTATGCWGFPSSGSFFSLCLSLSVFYFMFTFLKRWSRKEREGRETDRKRGRERERESEWEGGREGGGCIIYIRLMFKSLPPPSICRQDRFAHRRGLFQGELKQRGNARSDFSDEFRESS